MAHGYADGQALGVEQTKWHTTRPYADGKALGVSPAQNFFFCSAAIYTKWHSFVSQQYIPIFTAILTTICGNIFHSNSNNITYAIHVSNKDHIIHTLFKHVSNKITPFIQGYQHHRTCIDNNNLQLWRRRGVPEISPGEKWRPLPRGASSRSSRRATWRGSRRSVKLGRTTCRMARRWTIVMKRCDLTPIRRGVAKVPVPRSSRSLHVAYMLATCEAK